MEIKKENFENKKTGVENVIRKQILPGEINGLNTYYIKISSEESFLYKKKKNSCSIFLVFDGTGTIQEKKSLFKINEIALFIPSNTEEVFFYALNGALKILEIELELSNPEMSSFKCNHDKFPYFLTYSNCRQYKESIKSEKTINRMFLSENLIPRFCMGSVETSGPDKIEKHEHLILEQLFLGIKNNECIVWADGQETTLKENELLHIPLGSTHGVEVKKGKNLHYIWIDYFKSQEEMKYISENHIITE